MNEKSTAGPFPLPDESAGVVDFILGLRAIKVWAGDPSLEVLSRRTGEASSTLSDAFNPQRRRIPSLKLVRAVVRACGADPSQASRWEQAWRDIRERTDVIAPPPADPAGRVVSPGQDEWVPRQLPSDVSGFVGRADALTALTRRAGQTPVTVITGTAGVGKTALAVHWAHRIADQYPDGQLYLDLRGHAGDPAIAPTEALSLLLQSMGVPVERIPVDLHLQTGVYRSVLAGRRVLVVLDNGVDVAHVRPLLPPGPYCQALITSRDALTGLVVREGAARIVLDTLSPAESVELLTTHLGRDRVDAEADAAIELAELCAHLPLALRITAANLATRPSQTVAGTVTELKGSDRLGRLHVVGDPESAVAAAFDLSYRSLPAETRRLFRLLGLVPGPEVDRAVTAILLGRDAADPVPELDELVAAHLLFEPSAGRYRSHDLLALYARRHAGTESAAVRDEVLHRLLSWYLLGTEAATRIILPTYSVVDRSELTLTGTAPGFAGVDDALAWLRVELPNLTQAVIHAADHELPSFAWHLAHTLLRFLHTRGTGIEELAIARIGVRAAEAADHPRGRGLCHLALGTAGISVGDLAMAVEQFDRAREQFTRIGDARGRGNALNNLGDTHLRLGDIGRALPYFQEVTRDDVLGRLFHVLTNLALAHRIRGEHAAAMRLARESVAQAERADVTLMTFTAQLNLGMTLAMGGDLEAAEKPLLEAHSAAVRLGSDIGTYDTLAGLVLVCTRTGRIDEARAWIEPLNDLLERGVLSYTGDDWGHAAVLETHLVAGTFDAGIAVGTAALEHYEKAGHRLTALRVRLRLGQLHAARGDTENARRYWESALPYTVEQDLPEQAQLDALLKDRS